MGASPAGGLDHEAELRRLKWAMPQGGVGREALLLRSMLLWHMWRERAISGRIWWNKLYVLFVVAQNGIKYYCLGLLLANYMSSHIWL